MNRREAADFLDKCRWWFEPYTCEKDKWNEALDMAVEALRTGTWRWVDFWKKDRARVKHGIQCSECGECYDWNDPCVLPSYCPECGAKMEGGEENDRS